jgi:hypothetical protein
MRQKGVRRRDRVPAIMQIAARSLHIFSAGVCHVGSRNGIGILKLDIKIVKPIGK